ncbi:hypothetical protein RvY_16899 [Ramazzottius varieornatus]|uniref:Uncharacterized protein n=1 Tax=Ramazzottius varieornatus TaxID=947166 RepID=A0A1D1W7E0_RAMVA|nr:hypothetical protein RvY_16899 [Ramazzottius varieornatus]
MSLVNEGISNLLNSILSKTSKEYREEETIGSVDLVVSGTFFGVDTTRLLVKQKMPFILVVAGRLDLIETALHFQEGKPLDVSHGRMLLMSATKDNIAPDRVVKAMFQPLKDSVPSAVALLVN